MSKSRRVRHEDFLAITDLVGECRDLGDDQQAWRTHLIRGLTRMLDAQYGLIGEMTGCRSLQIRDLGVVFWWDSGARSPLGLSAEELEFLRDPHNWPLQRRYHELARGMTDTCLARTDFVDESMWKEVPENGWVRDRLGVNHRLYCYRPIDEPARDDHAGIIVFRDQRRRDFSPRDRRILDLTQQIVAPLVGGALARFSEPSPMDLSPRVRQVLRLLLQGDSDKQVADRLGISVLTVNDYTKQIYRHFKTRGRGELLARWIRRGWKSSLSGPDESTALKLG